jgi:hypothetical protein
MTTTIIDNRSILNSFHKVFLRNTNIKKQGSMNNIIMRKLIIGTKEKVITIYNINKWMSIMILKRIKPKIKIRKMLTIISNIKTIHLKTINLTNKQSKIIGKKIAIKNKNFKNMNNIIENQITKIWDK